MSVQRYVVMSFVLTGFLIWIVMTSVFDFALGLIGPTADRALIGVGFTLSNLLGLVSGIVGGLLLWRHDQVNTVAHEIANELKKVTWPNWSETKVSTLVVVVVTIICALILATYDAIWAWLTALIYGIG